MIIKIVFGLLIAFLIYAYTNHNREFTATASAIRQIWSGSCRLSCRHSENSRFSGLSGLVPRQTQGYGSRLSNEVKEGQTSINNLVGPSSNCVCETCPCTFLENVFITCSPATNLYSGLIETLSNFYYDIVRALTDLYVYIERVVNYSVACQRPLQSTILKDDSELAINFENASSSVRVDGAKKLGKDILNLKPSSISFRRHSDNKVGKAELHTSTGSHNIALNLQHDSLRPKSESKESDRVSKSCSRCIEEGKLCMKNCPRSKEKTE